MPKRKILNWPELLDEFSVGSKSVEEFCAAKSIHPNTFYKNRKKYQEAETQLVRLPLKPEPMQNQTLLIQAGGFILTIPEGVDQETLATTLRVLKDIR